MKIDCPSTSPPYTAEVRLKGRRRHGREVESRRAPVDPTAVEEMAHRLKTPEGRNLYAQRKQTPH